MKNLSDVKFVKPDFLIKGKNKQDNISFFKSINSRKMEASRLGIYEI